jgi:hypothetical protein
MSSESLNREQIIAAYQMLLGREPESNGTIEHHIRVNPTFEIFRENILTGPEFQSKYATLVENKYANLEDKAKALGFHESEVNTLGFQEFFDGIIAPRIDKRADTFRAAYRHLLNSRPRDVTVVETGCLRSAGNWAGDGQSTLQFEYLVRKCGGHAISVDYSPVSIAIAHYFCPSVQLVLSDSISYLQFLSARASNLPVDLLYLDSMDINPAEPMRSAEHHLGEIRAAWPLLRKGSIILIDDHDCPTDAGRLSKSVLANKWLADKGAIKVAEAYQIVWMVP